VDAVRQLFENKSLLDYSKSIGDYNLLSRKYKKPVTWNMKIQFIRNLYRYSIPLIVMTLKEFFKHPKES